MRPAPARPAASTSRCGVPITTRRSSNGWTMSAWTTAATPSRTTCAIAAAVAGCRAPAAAAGLSLSLHEEPSPEEVEAIRREELRKQQEKRDQLELERLQAAKAQAGG